MVWPLFALAVLLDLVGPMVSSFPSWVLDLEPFHHGLRLPATLDGAVGGFVMGAMAVALFAAATAIIGRRELRA